MRKTAFHKARETIASDYSYQVEVEISSILGSCFAVQGECSVKFDLFLDQIHDCLTVHRAAVLLFDDLRHEGDFLFGGYPRVRKQVFEHADGVAHDQTLRTRNRTDRSVLWQPVGCGDDLPLIEI